MTDHIEPTDDDAPPKRAPARPQTLLAALVRQQGRARISARELAELPPNARILVRVTDDGATMLTYQDPEE